MSIDKGITGGVGVLTVMDAEIASLPTMAEMASYAGITCDPTEPIRRLTQARATIEALAKAATTAAGRLQQLCDTRLRGQEAAATREEYQRLRETLTAFHGSGPATGGECCHSWMTTIGPTYCGKCGIESIAEAATPAAQPSFNELRAWAEAWQGVPATPPAGDAPSQYIAHPSGDGSIARKGEPNRRLAVDEILAAMNATTPAGGGDDLFALSVPSRYVEEHGQDGDRWVSLRFAEAAIRRLASAPARVGWQPIETAPKDNKRMLYLARFDNNGTLVELDFDAIWQEESESWELPQVYFYWASANGIEEPTHWAYQDELLPTAALRAALGSGPATGCDQQSVDRRCVDRELAATPAGGGDDLRIKAAEAVRACLDRDQADDDSRPLELWIADCVLELAVNSRRDLIPHGASDAGIVKALNHIEGTRRATSTGGHGEDQYRAECAEFVFLHGDYLIRRLTSAPTRVEDIGWKVRASVSIADMVVEWYGEPPRGGKVILAGLIGRRLDRFIPTAPTQEPPRD